MSDFNIKVKDCLQSIPLLSFNHLLNRHVNRFSWKPGVNDDHRKNSDRCGVDLWDAPIGRCRLDPDGHGVASAVVLGVNQGILDDRWGRHQGRIDGFSGLERSSCGAEEGQIPIDWIGGNTGIEGEGRRRIAVVLDLDWNWRRNTRRKGFCVAVHFHGHFIGFTRQNRGGHRLGKTS